MRMLWRNTKRAAIIRGSDNGVAAAVAKLTGTMVLAFALIGCKWAGYAPAMVSNRSAGYVYITNNGDGTVSQFSRQADGTLIFQRLARAGAVDGPIGIAVDPSNRFVYVANEGDNRVYEFRIQRGTGDLEAIGDGSVSDGPGSRPQQIAIGPHGDFVYVTNAGSGKEVAGSISQYAIDRRRGALRPLNIFRGEGLKQPHGIVIAPNGKFAYVSDAAAGTILAFAVGPDGTLKLIGSTPSMGAKTGQPGMIVIAPSGGFVYTVDGAAGVAAVFKAGAEGKLDFVKAYPVGVSTAEPLGIALAAGGADKFLYTANRAVDSVSCLTMQDGALTLVGQSGTGLGGPTGMAIDPDGHFLYVVNRDAATVAQFAVEASPSGGLFPAATIFTEDPANESSHSLYIAMTH
jgi:6-phosphogluconolactonase (cycloisomerase 2 family)